MKMGRYLFSLQQISEKEESMANDINKTANVVNPMDLKQNENPPIDGSVIIRVEEDGANAFLEIVPPKNGGKEITKEKVLEHLAAKGVRHNINHKLLDDIFEKKLFEMTHIIARMTPPKDGINGSIDYLFERNDSCVFKENEKGEVNFRDLGIIKNIRAGTIIANISLPTDGEPGMDVRGRPIPQTKGKPANFTVGAGTQTTPTGERIIAIIDGNLKWTNNQFIVEETVTIGTDVDLSVGNIDFIGDVVIKGMVNDGFKVKSGKSITVMGNVYAATLEARQNIIIKQGAINSQLEAGGDIRVGFCENADIKAEGNVTSQSFVGCRVFCGGDLQAVGGRAVIVGGTYTVLKDVTANFIGSESYVKTQLTLGNNAMLNEERSRILASYENTKRQIYQLMQTAEILTRQKKQNGSLIPEREEMLTSAIKNRFLLQKELKYMQQRIDEIDESMRVSHNRSVICKKELYPGTTVHINTSKITLDRVYNRCRVTLNNEGEVEIRPLA